ncbi:MAG: peptidoglycan-binding protein, partial [Microcoleus sp. SIO2G3]|nr:peptidoglycan-binding protein [Microcoleus sp. SIO2G3]
MQHSFRLSLLLISLIAVSPAPLAAQVAPPFLVAQVDGLLGIGDSGDAVVQLQTQLANLGFNPGAIDGAFGEQTEAAVIQFQNSQNLTPDGIAGPQTLAALNRLLGVPVTSPIVEPPVDFPSPVVGIPATGPEPAGATAGRALGPGVGAGGAAGLAREPGQDPAAVGRDQAEVAGRGGRTDARRRWRQGFRLHPGRGAREGRRSDER